MKWRGPAVEFHAENFRAQTYRRLKIDGAGGVPRGFHFQFNSPSVLGVLQIQPRGANLHVPNCEGSPIGGSVWRESERSLCGVSPQAEHATQQWADDHCRGPDLMRRARGKRLIISARKHFRDVSQRTIERQQRVGAHVRVRGKGTVIAILTHRSPAGEEWPDRSEMVAAAAAFRRLIP